MVFYVDLVPPILHLVFFLPGLILKIVHFNLAISYPKYMPSKCSHFSIGQPANLGPRRCPKTHVGISAADDGRAVVEVAYNPREDLGRLLTEKFRSNLRQNVY